MPLPPNFRRSGYKNFVLKSDRYGSTWYGPRPGYTMGRFESHPYRAPDGIPIHLTPPPPRTNLGYALRRSNARTNRTATPRKTSLWSRLFKPRPRPSRPPPPTRRKFFGPNGHLNRHVKRHDDLYDIFRRGHDPNRNYWK